MHVLIIGGTRNMGHMLALALLEAGHQVSVVNRGITRDDLPDAVTRLRADRTIAAQLEDAVRGQDFDAVVDFMLFDSTEAAVAVDLFNNRVGHYIFISTGQVYLLRDGARRPYTEADYNGPLIDEPPLNTYDHEEWQYGSQKRRVEDYLAKAGSEKGFPYTSLRLPMINSERDPFNRLYSYLLRMQDGGEILVPEKPDYPLRHLYAGDVVSTVMMLLASGKGKGQVFNLSQEETVSIEEFLALLGEIAGLQPKVMRLSRDLLAANGFLPDCSPFSDLWMSELDNTRSKTELGLSYTPLATYLEKLVRHYTDNPPNQPISYRRRQAERLFASQHSE